MGISFIFHNILNLQLKKKKIVPYFGSAKLKSLLHSYMCDCRLLVFPINSKS